MWHVYIVKCADQTLYTGVAKDVDARISQHNSGRGARYTKGRQPVKLIYSEPAEDRATALRREHAIKRMPVADKVKLVEQITQTFPDK